MSSSADLFYESRIHRGHKVLGFRLRPLCLLDLVALEAIGSPFAAGGRVPTGADLATAVRLLSRPHRDDLSIDADALKPSRLLRMRLRLADVTIELRKFNAYLDDHFTPVATWRERGEGGRGNPLGSPWIQTLATFVSRETSMTQREIWTGPIGHVLWLAASVEEQMSDARVSSDADTPFETAADEAENDFAALKQKEIEALTAQLTAGTISDVGRARLERLQSS